MIEKRLGFGRVGREIGTRRRSLGRFLQPCRIADWVGGIVHIHLAASACPVAACKRGMQITVFALGEVSTCLKRQVEEGDLHGLRELVKLKESIGDFDVFGEVGLHQAVDVGLRQFEVGERCEVAGNMVRNPNDGVLVLVDLRLGRGGARILAHKGQLMRVLRLKYGMPDTNRHDAFDV